jgi:hypothetical protein
VQIIHDGVSHYAVSIAVGGEIFLLDTRDPPVQSTGFEYALAELYVTPVATQPSGGLQHPLKYTTVGLLRQVETECAILSCFLALLMCQRISDGITADEIRHLVKVTINASQVCVCVTHMCAHMHVCVTHMCVCSHPMSTMWSVNVATGATVVR